MKSLETLIKLADTKLDNLKQTLNALYQQHQQLEFIKNRMQKELENEVEFIKSNPESTIMFDNFFKQAIENQKIIETHIAEIIKKTDETLNEIFGIFSEKKKYQIILQKRIEAAIISEKTKENNFLDEISITKYFREK